MGCVVEKLLQSIRLLEFFLALTILVHSAHQFWWTCSKSGFIVGSRITLSARPNKRRDLDLHVLEGTRVGLFSKDMMVAS